MAIQFDETTDYYSIADDASLTLQNGDWCVGIWTRVDENTGTGLGYLVSNAAWGANNSFNLSIFEAGHANSGKWEARVEDASGTPLGGISLLSSSSPGADGVNRLIIVQRRGNVGELIFCEAGQAASVVANGTQAIGSINSANAWNIGRRQDAAADRYYGDTAGEFFKGDFSLSLDEITALGAGLKITDLGYTPDAYLPMTADEATIKDIVGSNDATRNGTPATVEHFPLISYQPQVVTYTVAAAGGFQAAWAMASQRNRMIGNR